MQLGSWQFFRNFSEENPVILVISTKCTKDAGGHKMPGQASSQEREGQVSADNARGQW